MKRIALSEVKDDLSRYLRAAEKEAIVITRHGRPAGVLVGFADEDDWFDYRLENDPRFLQRVDTARASLRAGKGVRIEDLELDAATPKNSTRRSPTAASTPHKPRAAPRRVKAASPAKADA